MATKKGEVQPVKLAKINIRTTEITIRGDSPLIVHKFSEKARKEILDKCMQTAKSGREAKNPVQEFMQSLHWMTPMPQIFTEESFEKALKEGAKFGFPAVGIKQSAVSGAYRNGLTKDKVSVGGAFHIIGGELIEIVGVPKMRDDYAVIGNGAPEIRFRAEFSQWEMTFNIAYNTAVFSLDQILTFLNFGGFSVGIGDWRPEKSCGRFGTYKVIG